MPTSLRWQLWPKTQRYSGAPQSSTEHSRWSQRTTFLWCNKIPNYCKVSWPAYKSSLARFRVKWHHAPRPSSTRANLTERSAWLCNTNKSELSARTSKRIKTSLRWARGVINQPNSSISLNKRSTLTILCPSLTNRQSLELNQFWKKNLLWTNWWKSCLNSQERNRHNRLGLACMKEGLRIKPDVRDK